MYVLPDALRAELARPLAPPLPTERAVAAARGAPLLASVGDVVTEMLLDAGVVPRLAVVDYKTQRGPQGFAALRAKVEKLDAHRERFQNPPARITRTLWDAVGAALARTEPTVLEIAGEEDLAVLPIVALAPEGAVVVYGQPNEGAVVFTVDAAAKARVRSWLSRMESPPKDVK